MKRQYVDRKVTLEDIGRELVKDEPLEVQLAVSALIAKARQVAKEQQAPCAPVFVVDEARGWRLT